MSIDLTDAIKAMHGALASRWMTVADALSEDADYPSLLGDMLSAALPHLEQQIRAQIAAEIENRASQPRMEDSAPQWSVAKLQRDAYINGLSRAAQIARKENAND